MRLSTRIHRRVLRAPVSASHGSTESRALILVTISAPGGRDGRGEAAPLSSYDGVLLDDVIAALADCREPLSGWDGDPATRAQVLAACAQRAVLPQAIAAIDLALWDLVGRRLGQPVWRLLGDEVAAEAIAVNATIAVADRSRAAAAAERARTAGFATVKVKVGLGDDAGRVAAVRAAAGPHMRIRLDANGAWEPSEAAAWLRVLAPAEIELCEEPVHGLHRFQALAARQPSVPVALDESAVLPGALDVRYAEAVCLKIASSGGITGVLAAAARARATGYRVYLASTLDGPLGIAGALHAACAIRPQLACGLATLSLFAAAEDPLPPRSGQMSPPPGPGLGDGLSEWYG